MEETFATISAGALIIGILVILAFIAIIGTWTEVSRMRKNLEADIEETNEILNGIREELLNVNVQQKVQGFSNNVPTMESTQGEWLGSEQTR